MSPFSNLSKANPRVQHTRISLSFPSKIQSMKTTPCWRYYCRIRSSDVVEKGLLVIGVYTLVDFNFCLLLLCCYWRRWARVSKTCTCTGTGTPRSTVDSTVEVYWYTLSFFFSFFSLFFKREKREVKFALDPFPSVLLIGGCRKSQRQRATATDMHVVNIGNLNNKKHNVFAIFIINIQQVNYYHPLTHSLTQSIKQTK